MLLALAVVPATACELTEVSLARPTDEVVAEAFVQLRPTREDDGTPVDVSYVFLHRTLDVAGLPGEVPGAEVRIVRPDGSVVALPEAHAPTVCASELGYATPGTCYGPVSGAGIGAGETLELVVELPDGGRLTGTTTVPEPTGFVGLPDRCVLPPTETFELTWSRSEGAVAYVVEGLFAGLSDHFAPLGVAVDDPLHLLGLALSADDTTMVFPAEVGIFERADLEREVALLLQEGLPEGTDARVVLAAVDRNYVNWVRGGNFNPSGQVRVPSVRGDGTGFFGSAAVADLRIDVESDPLPGSVDCRGG